MVHNPSSGCGISRDSCLQPNHIPWAEQTLAGVIVGLDDLRGVFQPEQFCDSMIVCCAVQPFPLDEAEQDLVLQDQAGQGLVEARARHQCTATKDRDKLPLPWLREKSCLQITPGSVSGQQGAPKASSAPSCSPAAHCQPVWASEGRLVSASKQFLSSKWCRVHQMENLRVYSELFHTFDFHCPSWGKQIHDF